MHPAARALDARSLNDGNVQAGIVGTGAADRLGLLAILILDEALGDDEQLGQVHAADLIEQLTAGLVLGVEPDGSLQRLADALGRAGGFKHSVDIVAQGDEFVPAGKRLVGKRVLREGLVHLVEHDVALVVALAVRHRLPDLIAGEGEDRGKHFGHAVEDQVQSGLRTAALEAVLALAVQSVLDNIKIEAGQLHDAEVVDGMGDHMELVVIIGIRDLFYKLVELSYCPAVKLQHILRCDKIVRVEAVEVAEAVARGIAELQVVLAELLEYLLGAAHIDMVVGGACPEADHIRAELLDDIGGIDAVAEGLVHRLALAVNSPAVGQALFVRGALAQRADRDEQRGLEPAAILVAALHIHICRPEALVALHGGVMGGAGVKPAVQSVGLFGEVLAAAVRAGKAFGQKLCGVHLEPRVAALLFKYICDRLNALVGADGLMAVLAVEHGDRKTPAALTGDAPVGALADHCTHPILAPRGQPADVLAGGDSFILEGIYRAEPLRGGAEDDRTLAAPAVRVAMDYLLGGEESAALLHVVEDDGVGFVGLQSGVLAGIFGMAALIVDRDDHFHAVAHAGLIVVRAEAGSGMDAAGT